MSQNTGNNRIYGLDILRAMAILFVMQSHSLQYIVPHADVHYYWIFILDGVDLFFVLSGYLIGGILVRAMENRFDVPELLQFWIRRWFRTLPAYLLVLVVLMTGYLYTFHQFPPKAANYLSFTQCFNDPHPPFFSEAWSLAVEEWFYLLTPAALLLLLKPGRSRSKMILSWILLVLIGTTLFRIFKNHHYSSSPGWSWDMDIRKQVLTRFDSIMYGFLGAWFQHYRPLIWNKRRNTAMVAGLLLLFGSRIIAASSIWYHDYFYLSAQSIGTLLLLPKLSSIRQSKGLVYRIINFISIISYSMYLLNYTVVSKIIIPGISNLIDINYKTNALHSILSYALFWLVTICLSYVMYRFYEKPAMDIRKHFTPKQQTIGI